MLPVPFVTVAGSAQTSSPRQKSLNTVRDYRSIAEPGEQPVEHRRREPHHRGKLGPGCEGTATRKAPRHGRNLLQAVRPQGNTLNDAKAGRLIECGR